jgi:hypothetical protein
MSIPLGRSWGKTKKRLRRPVEENSRCIQLESAAPQGKKGNPVASCATACAAGQPAELIVSHSNSRTLSCAAVLQRKWSAANLSFSLAGQPVAFAKFYRKVCKCSAEGLRFLTTFCKSEKNDIAKSQRNRSGAAGIAVQHLHAQRGVHEKMPRACNPSG